MKNYSMARALILPALMLGISIYAGEHILKDSEKAEIAFGSKALFNVVTSKEAVPEIRTSAVRLAQILDKMTGAKFEITEGDGTNGIAVGTVNDFPEISFKPSFDVDHPGESQGYEIKSHGNGIYIIGATPQAVEYAVSDFLYRLGYRKFFPMDDWEIIPEKKTLDFAAHIRETPDYYHRRIWPGYGLWKEYNKASAEWDTANRNGGYSLNTGHAYEGIIQGNKKIFDQHPEYYGLLNGKRSSTKLCISNPDLRKLVADYALSRFENNTALKSFSVDPSDGGGWCECDNCRKLGTPSTRAVFLANTVAEAVRQKFPERRIGMYAYNHHSPPPAINVDQDVVISIATSFIKGGMTVEEIIKGWQEKKAAFGIREYYDVYLWSSNLPGKSRGSSLNYLKKTIPGFYDMGSRYLTAEASDNWGPNGRGYYLAERMLWNIKESENIDPLMDDFLDKCFGPAAPEMKEFYKLLDGSTPSHLTSNLLGKMYRFLEQAEKKADGKPDIQKRIGDLALYTRYSELYLAFIRAAKEDKQKAFDQLMEFSASIKNTRMVHTRALLREHKRIFQDGRETPAGDWKKAATFTQDQIAKIITDGVAANKLIDFDIISFSDTLIPAPASYDDNRKTYPLTRRGSVTYYTWADDKLQPWELSITGGLIKHYRDRGNVKCELWKIGGDSETGELETLVQSDRSTPPDGNTHTVKLTPKQTGLHKIIINDSGDRTKVDWPLGRPMVIFTDPANPSALSGDFYFYVPKGTKILGFFCNMGRGFIIQPGDKNIFQFGTENGYRSIPVPEGADDQIWKLKNINGSIALLTVPPYLAIEPSGLLLPEEVVTKDNLKIRGK